MRRRMFTMPVLSTLGSAWVTTDPTRHVLDGCRAKTATEIRAQNETGARLHALDGGVLRDTGACGAALLAFDATNLRHRNRTGAAIYHFDGRLLRTSTASGARILFREGPTSRAIGPSDAVIAQFERASPSWAAIAMLEAEGLVPS